MMASLRTLLLALVLLTTCHAGAPSSPHSALLPARARGGSSRGGSLVSTLLLGRASSTRRRRRQLARKTQAVDAHEQQLAEFDRFWRSVP